MKAEQVEVGRFYLAKVSGTVRPVKVERIEVKEGFQPVVTNNLIPFRGRRVPTRTVYHCKNMVTNRDVTVRSPQRFRCECDEKGRAFARPSKKEAADGSAQA